MHSTEALVIKIAQPTKRKRQWLENMAQVFSQAVQLGLNAAKELSTSSRVRLHKAVYYPAREQYGLPSDYARMAVNAAVSLARSFYGLRASQRRISFPKVNGSQGIGLGTNAYALREKDGRWFLRCSTGVRGCYIWLPLCVPQKYRDHVALTRGDAKLFQRGSDWYVMLPIRIENPTPAVCDGRTFVGVDLGIVRIATVSTPDQVAFFDGKAIRHRREHFADLRKRYQRHNRTDRVKDQKGKESHWMTDINHKISRQIVDLASEYEHPVIVLERLDGIRYRIHGSKRFNRMVGSWAFRQLVDMLKYKAARLGVRVVFVDPRDTSKMCSRCGHVSRSNRPDQSHFRCAKCGYQTNADLNASRNIAAKGPSALSQGPTDTARTSVQTGNPVSLPDGANDCAPVVHSDSNLSFPVGTSPF